MSRATLSSCSMRSRSRISCSRRCFLSVEPIVPMPHSSAILPSTMRWMTMALLVSTLPLGATPISSPRSWGECTTKRVTTLSPGYLILDNQASLRDGGMKSSDPLQVILAIRFLAGKQFITVDEVGGQHLVHGVEVPLDYSCLHETPSQCHVLFCRHRNSPPCQLAPFPSRSAPSMMPPVGGRCIDGGLFTQPRRR